MRTQRAAIRATPRTHIRGEIPLPQSMSRIPIPISGPFKCHRHQGQRLFVCDDTGQRSPTDVGTREPPPPTSIGQDYIYPRTSANFSGHTAKIRRREELERRLAAVPDLSESLRTASPQIKRQVFEAFDLQIAVDRTEGRVEISATVSEEVAKALNTKDPLAREGLAVVPKDIAGARFVSQEDARFVEQIAA